MAEEIKEEYKTPKEKLLIPNDVLSNYSIANNTIDFEGEQYYDYTFNTSTGLITINRDSPNKTFDRKEIGTLNVKTNKLELNENASEFERFFLNKPDTKNHIKKVNQLNLQNEGLTPEKVSELIPSNNALNIVDDDTQNSRAISEKIQKSKQFRKKYGNYCYPIEMKNTNQDRLKITVIDYEPADLEAREENTFEASRGATEKIRGSATLPIPNGVTDQNKVKFGDGTLNPAQVAGAQVVLNTLLEGLDSGANTLSNQVKSLIGDEGTAAALGTFLTSAAIGTNANQLLSRTQGAVFNNNLSLLFGGPTLRPFNFNFNVSPRDQKESIEVQKIIRMFKQSSAVQRTQNGLYLGTPHVFKLQFLSGGSTHKFLPRIKQCALLSFSTNYMPNGTYMTYENSSMVAYNLQFAFQELDPIFNDDYDNLDDFKSFEELTSVDPDNEEAVSISFDDNGGKAADSGGIGF